ncbi:HK97-gp10 family putative phage morphogenesis protein [Frisingicoccus sp.]|uniref:HK97-gp10 family putative phage morphogenesis protein n=1 Tax=Frisingicoccus sp. TaxID=1918627 RepID=UPI003AB393E4
MSDNEEFIKSLQNATFKILMEMTTNMNKACLLIEADAKRNCPKDTGLLAASITSEVEMTLDEIIGRTGTNLEYGPYVHNGTGIYAKDGNGRKTPWSWEGVGKYKGRHWTKGQKPQPFLEDARNLNASKVSKILGG